MSKENRKIILIGRDNQILSITECCVIKYQDDTVPQIQGDFDETVKDFEEHGWKKVTDL
jgi:hypothetical protein